VLEPLSRKPIRRVFWVGCASTGDGATSDDKIAIRPSPTMVHALFLARRLATLIAYRLDLPING
jgi:hypothetical protein